MDDVAIVNMALAEIRARTNVTSINPSDGTKAGDLAALMYQPRFDGLARAAHWNCLKWQASLTLAKAASGTPENPTGADPQPPAPWQYEYAWPSSPFCLKPRYIVPPINSAGGVPFLTNLGLMQPPLSLRSAIPFTVSADSDADGNAVKVILTNIAQASLVYTARITDPNLWDSNFVEAFVMVLSAWFAEPITGSDKLTSQKVILASNMVTQARISDGNEGPTSSDHLPDWIRVRSGTPDWAPVYAIGWDQLGFPGGQVM